MRTRAWQTILVPLLAAGAAQADDFYLAPAVTLAQVYDDNLFGSPDARRERDRFWRLSPTIEAGERGERFSAIARYGIDAERYREHPEFDATQARRVAMLDTRVQSTPTLTWLGNATYTQTQRPGELNTASAVDAGRASAERWVATPAVVYRVDPRRSVNASYSFTRDSVAGGLQTDTETTLLRAEEQYDERDSINITCMLQRFVFEGQQTVDAQSLSFGATRVLTPRTSTTLQFGPRFSAGNVDTEASAAWRYQLQPGELGANYARTHTTAIGLVGSVRSDAFGATLRYPSGRDLEIRIAPSVVRSERADFVARVYRFNLDFTQRWTRYLSFTGSYQYSVQRGALDVVSGERIARNVLMLGVTAATPVRPETEAPGDARPRTE